MVIDYKEETENYFVNKFGFNRGFAMIPNKISRCCFLPLESKIIYLNLLMFLNNKTKQCNPSQEKLAFYCGITTKTLRKYLRILEDSELIEIIKTNGVDRYIINEIKNAKILYHSELVSEVMAEVGKKLRDLNRVENVYVFFDGYKNSTLYSKIAILETHEMVNYKSEIVNWFYFAAGIQSVPIFNVGIEDSVRERAEGGKRRKKLHYKDMPIEEWNVQHFFSYFRDEYKVCFLAPYQELSYGADIKQLSNLIKYKKEHCGGDIRKSNTEIIEYLKVYFNNKYFDKCVRTVKGFCSSYVQNTISAYLTGKLGKHQDSETDDWYKQIEEKMKDEAN